MLSLLLLATAWAAAPAFADHGVVLEVPTDGTWPWGFGAPTVEWDGSQFVMFFESQVEADASAGCPERYVVGRATSPDGTTWTVDAAPVLEGDWSVRNSPRFCGVSQPAVAYDGVLWHLAFMQDEYTDAPRTTVIGGSLGYAQSADGVSWTIVEENVGSEWDGSRPWENGYVRPQGYPSVSIAEGEVYVHYTSSHGIGYARSGDWDGLRLAHYGLSGQYARYPELLFSPSVTCSDDPEEVFHVFFLARSSREDEIAWWTVNEAPWIDSRELEQADGSLISDYAPVRHADLLRVDAAGYLLWYTSLDGSGNRVVAYATTTESPGIPSSRSCDVQFGYGETFPRDVEPPPDTGNYADWPPLGSADRLRGDTGDTGDTGETGAPDTSSTDTSATDTSSTTATDSTTGTDTGEERQATPKPSASASGCTGAGAETGAAGCATVPAGSWVGVALVTLGVARRGGGLRTQVGRPPDPTPPR